MAAPALWLPTGPDGGFVSLRSRGPAIVRAGADRDGREGGGSGSGHESFRQCRDVSARRPSPPVLWQPNEADFRPPVSLRLVVTTRFALHCARWTSTPFAVRIRSFGSKVQRSDGACRRSLPLSI